MNHREFFEITHYRVSQCYEIPELIIQNLRQMNNRTFTLSSLQTQKKHPLSQLKQVNENIYYAQNQNVYLLQKKEPLYYVGDIVNILAVVRYKSMYEIESIGVQSYIEQKKKEKSYKTLKNQKSENIRENDEIFLLNEFKIEESDDFMMSYNIQYRLKAIGANQNTTQEEYKVEKKHQYIFKGYLPFESHYSMVTENFPEIYLEYQCTNISGQKLDFQSINFRCDQIMTVEKISLCDEKVSLYAEETIRIIFKINVSIKDTYLLSRVLTQKKEPTDYELKLGGIYLEWGQCGQYVGSTKVCNVRLQPIIVKFEQKQLNKLEKDSITKIDVDIQLGLFFPPSGAEILIRLDELEMKNVKIVGINKMKVTYDQYVRINTVQLSVVGTAGGMAMISGLKLVDSATSRPIPYKNYLQVFILNASTSLSKQQVQYDDLFNNNQQPQALIKQQSYNIQNEMNLLDMDQNVQNVDLI